MEQVKILFGSVDGSEQNVERKVNKWLLEQGDEIEITDRLQSSSVSYQRTNPFPIVTITLFYRERIKKNFFARIFMRGE